MFDRRALIVAAVVLLSVVSLAPAHGVLETQEQTEGSTPFAEMFSGAALILAAASLWISVRTRRLVESGGRME